MLHINILLIALLNTSNSNENFMNICKNYKTDELMLQNE